jgi:hypothetical protein
MGRILDANVSSTKRKDERILISPESVRKLKITSKESAIFIQGVPRHCILRDISFSGAKLIMMGVAKFLANKEAAIRIDFEDPRESFLIKGKFIRSEIVEGRKALVALVLLFDESVVPMGYKIRINEYISQVRADDRGSEKTVMPQPPKKPEKAAAPRPAAPAPAVPAAAKEAAAPAVAAKEAAAKEEAAKEEAAKPPPAPPKADDESFDLNFPSA